MTPELIAIVAVGVALAGVIAEHRVGDRHARLP